LLLHLPATRDFHVAMAGTAELLKAFEAHSTAVALLQLQHEDEHLALDAQQVKQRRDLCCRQQKEKEQHLQQEAVLRGGLISALNVQQLQLLEVGLPRRNTWLRTCRHCKCNPSVSPHRTGMRLKMKRRKWRLHISAGVTS